MKPTLFILLSALVACGGSSSKERPTEATFKVEVNPTDAKGGKWDRLGGDSSAPPDIGICVIDTVVLNLMPSAFFTPPLAYQRDKNYSIADKVFGETCLLER